jgi:hypothetical protein
VPDSAELRSELEVRSSIIGRNPSEWLHVFRRAAFPMAAWITVRKGQNYFDPREPCSPMMHPKMLRRILATAGELER